MKHDHRDPTPSRIEVALRPADEPSYAAAVHLFGEHDLATKTELQDALATVHGDLLLDLSACTFIDSTVIAVLLADATTRKREGHHVELLVPAENRAIMRTLELSGVAQLIPVRGDSDAVKHDAPKSA